MGESPVLVVTSYELRVMSKNQSKYGVSISCCLLTRKQTQSVPSYHGTGMKGGTFVRTFVSILREGWLENGYKVTS
jgi:hypothetical protein